ncbi:AAA family ATPase [Curvibacter sp. AEP1-3]|uniref:AAA family ATPase n=1 Tax=Curvibacter sp. AEP1-3 TaxID=1844971 RepID=UPI0012F7D075|nr:AAA family ATPase [Curvibacter sp. AEP1-3]
MDFTLPYATLNATDRLALAALLLQAECPPTVRAQYFISFRSQLKDAAKRMDWDAMAKARAGTASSNRKRVKAYSTALFRLLEQIDMALMREMAADLKLSTLSEELAIGEDAKEVCASMDQAGERWYDATTWQAAFDEANAGKSDEAREWKRALQSLKDAGTHKPYAALPDLIALDALKTRHPNFAEVIEFIGTQLAMAKRKKIGAFRVPPVLLEGAPGVGKSHFASALADVLGTTVHTVNVASQSAGFVLSGLHRSWSNGCMGEVATCLKRSQTLSPVFFLDELDKAGREGKSDPLGPLYALLEKNSAARFVDEYLNVGINASFISWVAAVNDTSNLPAPLLSRFTRFAIAAPTSDDMLQMAKSRYQQMRSNWTELPESMPKEWLGALAHLTPRAMGQRLERALGLAAIRAERTNSCCVLLNADDIYIETSTKPRMGFLAG